jgi:peptide-methionine (S)-S-oxide reductase
MIALDFPDPAVDVESSSPQGKQTAVFAGGCFWCTEAVFEHIEGVESVVSGYSGGDKQTANYETVSTGATGHAECVEITYDPARITYGQLLKIFFSVAHDPTQLNRQGPDHGRQYRSAIFAADPEQKKVAQAYIKQLGAAKLFKSPIVTEVNDLEAFYPAEQYHQNYCSRNPRNPYVIYNADPKVEKTKKQFPDLIKK